MLEQQRAGGGACDGAPAEKLRRVQTVQLAEGVEILCIMPSADGTALFCGLDDGSLALLAA